MDTLCHRWPVGTGHFFLGILWYQESKIWAFFKGLRSFRGPQKQERKNYQTWFFFQSFIKKVGFIKLIWSKFYIQNANLWSIYSKRFEFKVYTFVCASWKIKFFWLLRPSKPYRALKKDSVVWFLTFVYTLKN